MPAVGNWRVYLWRYSWGDQHLFKIGLTGQPIGKRIAAWSGWRGMTSAMTRYVTGAPYSWDLEVVCVTKPMLTRAEAQGLEESLHRNYVDLAVGHELFRPHEDFAPGFFGAREEIPDGSLFDAL